MTDEIHFEDDSLSASFLPPPNDLLNPPDLTPAPFTKPPDNFSTRPSPPHTIYYLQITIPHLDKVTLKGPTKAFLHHLPAIENIINNSPRAIDKFDALRYSEDVWGEREPNLEFEAEGFNTFVVEGQRGTYTVLRILRELNREVYDALPSPVFTVMAAGPLVTPQRQGRVVPGARAKGCASTMALVGSFVERQDAMVAAHKALERLVGRYEGVSITETWGKKGKNGKKGREGGVLVGMLREVRWEVTTVYEDQALQRAKEKMDLDGEEVEWRI